MALAFQSQLVEVVQTASVLSRKGFEVAFSLPAQDVQLFFPDVCTTEDDVTVTAWLIYAQAVNPNFAFPSDPRSLFITHNSSGAAAVAGDNQTTLRRVQLSDGAVYLARFPKILLKINSPDIELRFLFEASSKRNPGKTHVLGCSSPFVIIKDERTAKKAREARRARNKACDPYPQRVPRKSDSISTSGKVNPGPSHPAPAAPALSSLTFDLVSYGSNSNDSSDSSHDASATSSPSLDHVPDPSQFSMVSLPSSFRYAEDSLLELERFFSSKPSDPKTDAPRAQITTADSGEHAVPQMAVPVDAGMGEYSSPTEPRRVTLAPGQEFQPKGNNSDALGLGDEEVPPEAMNIIPANSSADNSVSADMFGDEDEDDFADDSSGSIIESPVPGVATVPSASPAIPQQQQQRQKQTQLQSQDSFGYGGLYSDGLLSLDDAIATPSPPPPAPQASMAFAMPVNAAAPPAPAGGAPPPPQSRMASSSASPAKPASAKAEPMAENSKTNSKKLKKRSSLVSSFSSSISSIAGGAARGARGLVRKVAPRRKSEAADKGVVRDEKKKVKNDTNSRNRRSKAAVREKEEERARASSSDAISDDEINDELAADIVPAKAAGSFSDTFKAALTGERAVSLSDAIAQLRLASTSADDNDSDNDDDASDDGDADAKLIAQQAAQLDKVLLNLSQVRIA